MIQLSEISYKPSDERNKKVHSKIHNQSKILHNDRTRLFVFFLSNRIESPPSNILTTHFPIRPCIELSTVLTPIQQSHEITHKTRHRLLSALPQHLGRAKSGAYFCHPPSIPTTVVVVGVVGAGSPRRLAILQQRVSSRVHNLVQSTTRHRRRLRQRHKVSPRPGDVNSPGVRCLPAKRENEANIKKHYCPSRPD